ncbi:alkene reductase [Pseudobacteriovorax antillogorgiicola]|uniref:N-ethylmaleimide reductase n=1 Tax=Pseudobacteriovorax antillogorgiicola TaxID=1513793 RepID=A0A1Y6CP27_9BACT|nr:alkene reductase [Pseudobacteriovorax antillogorgiicola]TCS43513.1 N-ethylmaleimide reductase [Pseudobacteriovorax antillogorgiicola]SMF81077.1 N-ethylmaleimide reductase [Pseudobacteriovorax antillogorgiicola]
MAQVNELLKPIKFGDIEAKNRVFMAPLTRNRAHEDGTPKDMAVTYYQQRASAGLIVTEATQVSPLGKGYLDTPGIYNERHQTAWKKVVEGIHDRGGKVFLQLWHVGRISHVSLLPEGERPLAPSAIRAEAQTFAKEGFVDVSEPREIRNDEIATIVEQYKHAAELCKAAGFDGVEVHGANGYLINQFLASNSNQRQDEYGGSAENKSRFLIEVLDAVIGVYGASRVGLRLSPTGKFNGINDEKAEETYTYLYKALNKKDLAYLHVVEQFPGFPEDKTAQEMVKNLKQLYTGTYIANGGYTAESGEERLKLGLADAIAYGRPFISNPDLPERFANDIALAEPDQNTFYGGDEKGYTDYPSAT